MKGRNGIIVALVALSALASAGVALATKTRHGKVPEDAELTFKVKCPPGTHVTQGSVSGDINGTVFSPDVEFEYLESLGGNITGVFATFYNYGKGEANVELDVLCSNGDPHTKMVTSTTTVAPNSPGTATAKCPAGTTVRYGGYRTTFAPSGKGAQITVTGLTRPKPRKWTVSGFNYRGPAGPLEAIAYCGKGPKLTPHTKTVAVPSYAQVFAKAKCPAGRQVLLGGFSAPYSAYGPIFDSMDTPTERTWKVGVFDYTPAPTHHKLTAIAYCG